MIMPVAVSVPMSSVITTASASSKVPQVMLTWPRDASDVGAAFRDFAMTKNSDSPPDIATRIMAAMVRMPPKPHEEMKLGEV